ncbi:MAG TPA: molybdopterin molybdenumtransferase MoeA, partial [Chromatiales bacterium]|nr:molybdopterin molybdenumtransferase MoeA [Chromatiales bacterium]
MNTSTRIDTSQADQLIRKHMPEYGSQPVALTEAHGMILRETIHAERDQPPFDRVTMDGIAIRHADLEKGRRFTVQGTQAAGMSALTLDSAGSCIEVMTGAVLPHGADTVIPVERIRREQNLAILDNDDLPAAGQFVHRQGSDHREGYGVL